MDESRAGQTGMLATILRLPQLLNAVARTCGKVGGTVVPSTNRCTRRLEETG